MVDLAGLAPLAGKGVAVVITFFVVYIMRAGYVFNGRQTAVEALATTAGPTVGGR
jgi:hypothetical protein